MIILFGPAGSGKSLQGQCLAEKYEGAWLSVGELLRQQDNPEFKEMMDQGILVDDTFVVKMMHEAMDKADAEQKLGILDGYPRNEWQAQWIVDNGDAERITGAIIFRVSNEELWNRLALRGRSDDTKESIERRWGIFSQTIDKMCEILSQKGVKIAEIDGVGEIEVVTSRLEAVLKDWGVVNG